MKPTHIAIVGAGFTGTALAARLLQTLSHKATVTIIEASSDFGPGLAYGTRHPAHLMNTPANVIGAVPGRREHFVEWLGRQPGADQHGGTSFVPRSLYGRYLRDLLDDAAHRSDVGLSRLTGEVIGLARSGDGFVLSLASGRRVEAAIVALCTGYGLAPGAEPERRIVDDPWAEGWIDRVAPDDAVFFKGSGLTMVDQVLRLRAGGHRGPLLAISRHGLLPQAHSDAPLPPVPAEKPATVASLARLLGDVRKSIGRHDDWRVAFDGLRPLNRTVWAMLDPRQRARFDRHVRPYWNVHRHRMAPAIANVVNALRADGTLRVEAGRIERTAETPGSVCLAVRWRGSSGIDTARAAWLVDCARPTRSAATSLEWSLLGLGLARRQGRELRLDVAADGALRDGDGSAAASLYALGPPARGTLGEITAIPEIRELCGEVAAAIDRTIARRSAAAEADLVASPLMRNPRFR